MSKENVNIILNADDFGYSTGVNQGIIEGIEQGILTSTSVMVRRPAAGEAQKLTKYENISIGLHIDLTEEGIKRWLGVVNILTWPYSKIEKAFNTQIKQFIEIVGRPPDHIDSHHHIHWLTRFKKVTLEYAQKHNIPVRCKDATFVFDFYGRSFTSWSDPNNVSPEKLIRVIENLHPGIHEIMCHPGYVDEGLIQLESTYLYEREAELKALISPKVKKFVDNSPHVKLISWKEVSSINS